MARAKLGEESTRPLPPYLRDDPEPFGETPIADQDEDVLPFLRMPWRNFEKLNLAIAEREDGLRDAVEYGAYGAAQEGIDFAGRVGVAYAGYQARRVRRKLTGPYVRCAVVDFLDHRPLDARRFVLCTAQPARSTPVQKELKKLRDENPDLEIEVRGAERLSSMLADHPDLVVRFFNEQYRDRFCARARPPQAAAQSAPAVEALLRGPVRALKLQKVLLEAETAIDPAVRAAAYARLAEALASGPYQAFARSMREREAEALLAAGEVAAACHLWLDIAGELVELGLAPPRPHALFRVREHAPDGDSVISARRDATEAFVNWYIDGTTGCEALRDSLEQLRATHDAWMPRVAMWWAECCLVDERFADVEAAASDLGALAALSDDEGTAVRLRIVIAEATGDWAALAREAQTGQLSQRDCGLVLARHGRLLAWTGDPEGALDRYRQAMQPLMEDGLDGDVRACLHSIWRVQVTYGPDTDAELTRQLIQTVRGGRSRFGEAYDARRSALEELHDRDWREAHSELRRVVWEARVSGHLDAELDGRKLLGDLYAATGEPAAAQGNYIRAARHKEAAAMAALVGDPPSIDAELQAGAPWMVAAALAVLAEDGDRRTADETAMLAPLVLGLVHGRRQTPFGPQVWQQAFSGLAGIALQLTDDVATEVLDLIEPLVPRNPNHGRLIDDQILAILANLYDSKPDARGRVRRLLLLGLEHEGVAAGAMDLIIARAGDDGALRELISERAESGDRRAALVLACAGIDHPEAMSAAEEHARAFLARPQHTDAGQVELTSDVARDRTFGG
jgi:hypothetical protein